MDPSLLGGSGPEARSQGSHGPSMLIRYAEKVTEEDPT